MARGNRALLKVLSLVPRPLVWRFARIYIAGEKLADAVRVIQGLNGEGCRATVDVLGEGATSEREVEDYVSEYARTVDAIVLQNLDANISVKPTALGLNLSRELAYRALDQVIGNANRQRIFVRIDMEDSSVTQTTLDLFKDLREAGHEKVGVVLQAYLRRTLADARWAAEEGVSVRLCKGIYVEPRGVAYQDYWTIRDSFVDSLETLLSGSRNYTGIATHDEWLVMKALGLIHRLGLGLERYEFQMLLGVDPQLRQLIRSAGHGMRVYVPFGAGWFAYSVRRLLENPRLAGHVTRHVLGFGPGRKD